MRGHYLRMPFKLLIPHLFRKAFISPFNQDKNEEIMEEDSIHTCF